MKTAFQAQLKSYQDEEREYSTRYRDAIARQYRIVNPEATEQEVNEAANADWGNAPGYYIILSDQAGEQSWPITAATFILMHKQPTDKAAAAEAIKFFTWAFEKGDKAAEELDYIPMPDSVVNLIKKTWSADIKS